MHYRATVFDFVKIPHLHPTLAEIWTYPAEEIGASRSRRERPLADRAMSFDVAIVQFKPRKGDVDGQPRDARAASSRNSLPDRPRRRSSSCCPKRR